MLGRGKLLQEFLVTIDKKKVPVGGTRIISGKYRVTSWTWQCVSGTLYIHIRDLPDVRYCTIRTLDKSLFTRCSRHMAMFNCIILSKCRKSVSWWGIYKYFSMGIHNIIVFRKNKPRVACKDYARRN